MPGWPLLLLPLLLLPLLLPLLTAPAQELPWNSVRITATPRP
jgi:hypothetical protein